MTVPPDRRVWQQALALRKEGWRVSVITPKVGSFRKSYEKLNGIDIYRHPLLMEARGIAAYIAEYSSALFFEALYLMRLNLKDVDVVQICNPPDFLFMPALLGKIFGGAKVVFDHHDLTPELLVQKTGNHGALLSFARWAERRTFATADRVISTNESFADHALQSGRARENVNVVYSTPDLEKLLPGERRDDLRLDASTVLLWVGLIGSQDGLDLLIKAMARLQTMPAGEGVRLLVVGDGPERAAMEDLATSLGLAGVITFTGFLSGNELADAFASADIGIGSDPKNEFNDRLAMNKVFEYMAYRLPIVMFELAECKKIAGDAAFYAVNNDPSALAARVSNLIQLPSKQKEMGELGRRRLEDVYSWAIQKERYLDVYRSLLEQS